MREEDKKLTIKTIKERIKRYKEELKTSANKKEIRTNIKKSEDLLLTIKKL